MPLDPQVQAYLDKLAALGLSPMSGQTPQEARALMQAETLTLGPPPAVGAILERVIPGPGGDLLIRVTTPAATGTPSHGGLLPALVFFHGGGWVVGNTLTHDALCRALTSEAGIVVASADYRLAPEHAFPAAVDDAYAVTLWVSENAVSIGVDPTRIAVGGDSAGGNLAAVVALMSRDRGGPQIALQLLIYPITGDDLETPSYHEFANGYMLTREAMAWYWNQYVPDRKERSNPYVSPLRANDLSGLPPALVVTAEYDVLRDEAEAYARRLAESGVAARLLRYDGLIHGFLRRVNMFDRARSALTEIAGMVRAALGTS
jgi:acetyl esterase